MGLCKAEISTRTEETNNPLFPDSNPCKPCKPPKPSLSLTRNIPRIDHSEGFKVLTIPPA